jgi:hypothetical protein
MSEEETEAVNCLYTNEECSFEADENQCALCGLDIAVHNFSRLYQIVARGQVPFLMAGRVVSVTKVHRDVIQIYEGLLEKYRPEEYVKYKQSIEQEQRKFGHIQDDRPSLSV